MYSGPWLHQYFSGHCVGLDAPLCRTGLGGPALIPIKPNVGYEVIYISRDLRADDQKFAGKLPFEFDYSLVGSQKTKVTFKMPAEMKNDRM